MTVSIRPQSSFDADFMCFDEPGMNCFAYCCRASGTVSIVMEFMNGGSLQDIVDNGGCQSEKVLANISARVLHGLAFIHESHQIHRDIKPSNLLINHFGEVKISDFGTATVS